MERTDGQKLISNRLVCELAKLYALCMLFLSENKKLVL